MDKSKIGAPNGGNGPEKNGLEAKDDIVPMTEDSRLLKAQELAKLNEAIESLPEGDINKGPQEFRLRATQIRLLEESGTLPELAKINSVGGTILLKGGREAANDSKTVELVRKATEIQKKVTSTSPRRRGEGKVTIEAREVDKTGSGVLADMTGQLSKYGETEEEVDAKNTSSIEFTEDSTSGYKIIKQGDQTKEVDSKKQEENSDTKIVRGDTESSLVYPSSVDIDLGKMEQDAQEVLKKQNGESAKLSNPETVQEAVSDKKPDWKIDGPKINFVGYSGILRPKSQGNTEAIPLVAPPEPPVIKEDTTSGDRLRWKVTELPPKVFTPEEDAALDREYLQGKVIEDTSKVKTQEDSLLEAQKNVEELQKSLQEAMKKVEQIKSDLEKKSAESKKNLEAMGLTKVGKGLEAFKNMSGKKKLLLGVALAGLSVATGGATSFISTGLSALTFGLRDFDKEKAKAQEKGEEVKKMMMLKSAVTGLVLALGTGALFSVAGQAISMASEHFSPMMDSIKHFFSPETVAVADSLSPGESIVPVGPEILPVAPDIVPTPDVVVSDIATPDAVTPDIVTPDTVVPDTNTPDVSSYNIDTTTNVVTPDVVTPDVVTHLVTPEIPVDMTSPINLDDVYTMQPSDNTDSILRRVLATVPELNALPEEGKLKFISDLKDQWSTPISGASTPNWALKEMIGGVTGTEVHHLDHVKNAFVTLGERANIISTIRN